MNSEASQPVSPAADAPPVADTTVPIWLIVLMSVLLYGGAIYFDQIGGWFSPKVYTPYRSVTQLEEYLPRAEGPSLWRGEQWYNTACSLCHGIDGAGKPGQAPPLAGSDWVNAGGVNRLVRIPVLGLSGPIRVSGKDYVFGTPMTAVFPNSSRELMTDELLADILSYIRQAWGNTGSLVTAAEVKAVRDEIGNRSQQLTVVELQSLPEKP